MPQTFAHFTEESNALDYLQKAVTFIRAAKENPQEWKWVVLAIHESLYGYLICALKGTDPDNNVCKKTMRGRKLITFREALKRCEGIEYMAPSGYQKPLSISGVQRVAAKRIQDEFHNQFLHYRPVMWSIETSGMPALISHTLDIIESVVFDMQSYYTHHDVAQVKVNLDGAREALGSHRQSPQADHPNLL